MAAETRLIDHLVFLCRKSSPDEPNVQHAVFLSCFIRIGWFILLLLVYHFLVSSFKLFFSFSCGFLPHVVVPLAGH